METEMSTTLRHMIRVLHLALAFVLPLTSFACTPKALTFPGRFLYYPMITCQTEDQFSMLEYKAGMEAPAPLWTGIPCQTHSNRLAFPISPDGRYAMTIVNAPFIPSTPPYFSLMLLDLTNGKTRSLAAPEYDRLQGQQMKASGAFSSDDRYFAYTVNSLDHGPDRLYLLDLASGNSSILFDSPCASYNQTGSGMGSTFCAMVGFPYWIDATSLVFSGYSGKMPGAIQLGVDIEPNHTFVMGVDGTILQDLTPALYIRGIYGPTVLFHELGKTENGYQWQEAAELKQGKVDPHPLDVDSQFRARQVGSPGYLEGPSISPDGQYTLQRIGGVWHLIGLRTGTDAEIRNTRLKDCYYFLWSPDQKNVLCSEENTIISLEGAADQKMTYLPDLTWFAWLP
jgi:hypothetical protein